MDLVDRFQIPVLEEIALRNPQATQLGQRIIEGSILLIVELGFEQFTFVCSGLSFTKPQSKSLKRTSVISMVLRLCQNP